MRVASLEGRGGDCGEPEVKERADADGPFRRERSAIGAASAARRSVSRCCFYSVLIGYCGFGYCENSFGIPSVGVKEGLRAKALNGTEKHAT